MSGASPITTHVLDTARGKPAAAVPVHLEWCEGHQRTSLARGVTDACGRLHTWWQGPLRAGTYRLTFDTATYHRAAGVDAFYPEVAIVFTVSDSEAHYHVPLLLSPFGYSTYRGS